MAAWFNKWLLLTLLPSGLYINGIKEGENVHPIHVSVVEMNHNREDKALEITIKLFRDDFEKVLIKNNKTKVDLINPTDKAAMENLVNHYIYQHLRIKSDGKQLAIAGIGFEFDRSEDAVYSYFQVENLAIVKNIDCENTLMHDLFEDQQNIIHVMVGNERKSTKLNYPRSLASFSF